MSEKTWTTDEDVLFQRYEDAFPFGLPDNAETYKNCILGRVMGTTAAGQRFMNITPVTEELMADKGEAWVAAMLREDARPPEGEPPPDSDWVFDDEE